MARFVVAPCLIVIMQVLDAGAAFELDAAEIQLPFVLGTETMGYPAAPAASPCWRGSLLYHLPFGLRELQHSLASVTGSVFGVAIGAGVSSGGFQLHRETSATVSVATVVGPLGLGVSAGHLVLLQRGGIQRRFQRWRAGLRIRLPARRAIRFSWKAALDGFSSARWLLGLEQEFGGGDQLLAHAQRRAKDPPVLDLGLVHYPHRRLGLLLGTRSSPQRFAIGLSWHWRNLYLEQVIRTHSQLGPSQTTMIGTTCSGR